MQSFPAAQLWLLYVVQFFVQCTCLTDGWMDIDATINRSILYAFIEKYAQTQGAWWRSIERLHGVYTVKPSGERSGDVPGVIWCVHRRVRRWIRRSNMYDFLGLDTGGDIGPDICLTVHSFSHNVALRWTVRREILPCKHHISDLLCHHAAWTKDALPWYAGRDCLYCPLVCHRLKDVQTQFNKKSQTLCPISQ